MPFRVVLRRIAPEHVVHEFAAQSGGRFSSSAARPRISALRDRRPSAACLPTSSPAGLAIFSPPRRASASAASSDCFAVSSRPRQSSCARLKVLEHAHAVNGVGPRTRSRCRLRSSGCGASPWMSLPRRRFRPCLVWRWSAAYALIIVFLSGSVTVADHVISSSPGRPQSDTPRAPAAAAVCEPSCDVQLKHRPGSTLCAARRQLRTGRLARCRESRQHLVPLASPRSLCRSRAVRRG